MFDQKKLDELQKQIAARSKEAGENKELVAVLSDLQKKIGAVAGPSAGGGFGGFGLSVPGTEPATLRQVSAAMGTLLGIVDGADVAPSADAVAASEKWESAGKTTLAQWNAILTKDLASANSLLEKAHLQALKTEEEKTHP